jgi:hypothetical protein
VCAEDLNGRGVIIPPVGELCIFMNYLRNSVVGSTGKCKRISFVADDAGDFGGNFSRIYPVYDGLKIGAASGYQDT